MAKFKEYNGWVCECGRSWWVQDWLAVCDIQLDDDGSVYDHTDHSFQKALGPVRCGACETVFTVGEVENE